MLKKLIPLFLFIFTLSAAAESSDKLSRLTLSGTNDKVASILNDSMTEEFFRGKTKKLTDQVGFKSNFISVTTGSTEIQAILSPLIQADSLEPNAFSVELRWKTGYGDGKKYADALINQIKNKASKYDVEILDSEAGLKTLPDQASYCFGLLAKDADFDVLSKKIALDSAENTTAAMLADDSNPTDTEREAIALLANKRAACGKPMKVMKDYSQKDPAAPLYQSFVDTAEKLLLSLHNGQLTYGNYNKIRMENLSIFQEGAAQINKISSSKSTDSSGKAKDLGLKLQKEFIEHQNTYKEMFTAAVENLPAFHPTDCKLDGNRVSCTMPAAPAENPIPSEANSSNDETFYAFQDKKVFVEKDSMYRSGNAVVFKYRIDVDSSQHPWKTVTRTVKTHCDSNNFMAISAVIVPKDKNKEPITVKGNDEYLQTPQNSYREQMSKYVCANAPQSQ